MLVCGANSVWILVPNNMQIGVVTSGTPKMVALSYCEHGEMQGALTKSAADGTAFDLGTKYRFCYEIADGMRHIASLALVHRDLVCALFYGLELGGLPWRKKVRGPLVSGCMLDHLQV